MTSGEYRKKCASLFKTNYEEVTILEFEIDDVLEMRNEHRMIRNSQSKR